MANYKIIPSSRTIVQSPISIGHKAEKGVEAIEFDVTAWVETYGSGTLTVIMRRWGDAIPYPIALEIDENNKATWTLSDIDTAKAGMAYAQLNYIVGDEVVKKSDIYTFRVMDSLTGEGEPPEAYESWLEHLTHFAAEAMAEVLDIEGIVTDKTLTVDGGIADGKATGDALALKADKATTYTKAEVDQMIEDVEVETDTTLEIAGAPADAKTVGDGLGAINESLGNVQTDLNNEKEERNQAVMNSSDGVYNLGMYSKFVNGALIDGVVYTNQSRNRISSVSIITVTKDTIVKISSGFELNIFYFVDGTYSSTTGWLSHGFMVPANSSFRCMIRRVSEITEVADILTFLDQVTVDTDLSMVRYTVLGCGFYAISGWVYGRYLKCNTVGSIVNINSPTANASYKYAVVPCSAGDKFTINGTGGGNPRLWAFLDSSYEVLTNSDASASASNLVLTAPTNAAYLILNDSTDKISFVGVLPISLVGAENTEMVGRTKGIVDLKLTMGKSDNSTGKWYWTTGSVTNAKNVYIVSKGDTLHTNWANYYLTYVEFNNDYTVKRWHQIGSDTYIAVGVIYRVNVVQRSGNATTQAERDAMIAATYATTDGYASNMSVDTDKKRLNLIEDKLSDEFLPDYAEAGAKRIIGQLKAKSPDGNLLVFGFNTDQHISYPRDAMPVNVNPVLTGLAALKKITQGYPTDFVCLGGDGVVASETDIAHILDSCVTIQTPLQGASCPIVPLTGNHDAAQNNANITGAMLFNAHFKRVANSGFLDGWDNTHTNGYWESKSHKCRVIFLDDTLRTDYTTADRSAALTAMLADVPDDYRIIIFSHHPISSALENDGWFNPLGLQSIIQPYASQIICCISGHGHMDESETSDGILYIGTTMAAYGTDQEGNSRTLNTENETAYDVFCIDESNNIYAFRYGYGEDRSWLVE